MSQPNDDQYRAWSDGNDQTRAFDGYGAFGDGGADVGDGASGDVGSRASAEDTRRAIAAAKAAFPAWSRSGIQQRHDILKKASDEILARREELGKLLSREEGKTLAEGIERALGEGIVPIEHLIHGTARCLCLEDDLQGLAACKGASLELL